MTRWNNPGLPHKGWRLVGFEDIGDNPSADYETCEMCGHERIRYVHILEHPEFDGCIRVGCDCAEKLTNDYSTHKQHENYLKKRAARRRNFLKQEWVVNRKGNLVLRYKGEMVTAIQRNSNYGFGFRGVWTWEYKGQKIRDCETLKIAAFDVFDRETHLE